MRSVRPKFREGGPFVVRRLFVFEGEKYKPGDGFDCGNKRRLRQMYDARKIDLKRASGNVDNSLPQMTNEQILEAAKAKTGVNYRSVERAKAALCDG